LRGDTRTLKISNADLALLLPETVTLPAQGRAREGPESAPPRYPEVSTRRTALDPEGLPARVPSARFYPLVLLFFGLAVTSLGGLLLPQIPQDQGYHQFADQRTMFAVLNFWNVLSNLPFLAVGVAGLRRFRSDLATVVFFLGSS
jgi:hypothetical protein